MVDPPIGELELNRLAVENTRELITLVDPDGTIVFASSAVTPLLGYAPEEFVGTPVFDHVDPEDSAAVRQAIEDALQGGRPSFTKLRLRHRDGHVVVVETSGHAILDEDGVPRLLVGSVRPVGERPAV